ncbi:unnamed protein product [Prorocentrum cordatum]|uniref:Uncharacterized protein n=1 Tax=Prorocentrum cordatum TaxID=2364126 RepID=A0ABN9VGR2_9DINO|nr:unnamed protein product [Polarella glacialis]
MPPMQGEDSLVGQPPEDDLGDCLGYASDFRRYGRAEIIEICSGMDDVAKPDGFARLEAEDPSAAPLFLESPCKETLFSLVSLTSRFAPCAEALSH